MNSEVLDRRVRKTRTKLRQCLAELLKTKSIHEITVTELAKMADINRGTFYLHYRDVYDLLEHIEADILKEFHSLLTHSTPAMEHLAPFIEIMLSFIQENSDIFRLFMENKTDSDFPGKLREELKRTVFQNWASQIRRRNLSQFELYYEFALNGTLGMIENWLRNEQTMKPGELSLLIEEFIQGGLTRVIERG